METQDQTKLQQLRRDVLAACPNEAAARINALLVLGFRKITAGNFSSDYFQFSFWPQLLPYLSEPDQPALAARFRDWIV
ncbi:hypothetical protein [Lacticaseibacillus yichunensis]|uniref:Uncharacterized protein n=1 Tax=Lacticaseibacillus yichunensis TaxID=2486015 RepID=A0ABW4CP76_9LACO|nr:hypothetical protein [Lacticaseibacillus yichunensis]